MNVLTQKVKRVVYGAPIAAGALLASYGTAFAQTGTGAGTDTTTGTAAGIGTTTQNGLMDGTGMGQTATPTPGLPDTGVGEIALSNMVILGIMAAAIIVGIGLLVAYTRPENK